MTSLQDLNLRYIELSTEGCDQVISAIVACQQANPYLNKINLYCTGGDYNKNFSDSANAQVADLKAKGVEIKQER